MASAIVGFIRGFTNEVFTILGWIAAVIATLFLTPVFRDFGRGFFDSKIIADMATAAVIFVITLGICTAISYFTSQSLRESRLNAVDRSLGFGFGILRSVILLSLAYLMVAFIWEPADRPTWIMEAKTRPVLETTASMIKGILPGDVDIQVSADEPSALDKVMNGEKEKPELPTKDDQTGYSGDEREKIEDFFNR